MADLLSTVEVAETTGADYQDLLLWAEENEVPRVGATFAWREGDVAAYLTDVEADEDDNESFDDNDDDYEED